MTEKNQPSPKEDSSPRNSHAWVFDERMGWIDVGEFLSRTTKLNKELTEKIKDNEKE